MTRARIESWATAFIAAVLCLYAIAGGASLVRLGHAEARGDGFRSLVGDPFVGAAASLDLDIREPSADPKERAREIEALLARAPLNPGAWLDLAVARRAAGEDISRVVEALQLSALTGPREARLMAGRVAFALPFWRATPQDLRTRLIEDLVGVAPYLETQERERIAALVRLQAPEEIGAICGGLRRREVDDAAAFEC